MYMVSEIFDNVNRLFPCFNFLVYNIKAVNEELYMHDLASKRRFNYIVEKVLT